MKIIKILSAAFLIPVILILSPTVFSQQDFGKDTNYDIYYEVSPYEVDVVKGVRIIGLINIGESQFLEIFSSGFSGKEKKRLYSFLYRQSHIAQYVYYSGKIFD